MFKNSKKSYKLESIYDPKKGEESSGISTTNGTNGTKNEKAGSDTSPPLQTGVDGKVDDGVIDYSDLMETAADRRRRRFSLAVICFTSFTFTFSYSIILTSAKPYLDRMDPDAGTQFLGLFIAAQPLAQLFFSPLMGFLANKIGSIRYLSMTSTLILAAGFSFYACISAMPEPRRWYLFASRFLIGAAGGANTLSLSYIASATTLRERTQAVSINALAAAAALVIGPVVQAAFTPLDYPGYYMGAGLYFNVYTAPSWLSVLLCLFNCAAFLPCIFTEYSIAKEEGAFLAARNLRQKNKEEAERGEVQSEAKKFKKPDQLSLIICIIIFASVQFNFIFLESLTTLMAMEMLGWSETDAIARVGIFFACAGAYIAILYIFIGPLSRKIGERMTQMLGLLFLIAGPIALYPYAGPHAPYECLPVNHTIPEVYPADWSCPNATYPHYEPIMMDSYDSTEFVAGIYRLGLDWMSASADAASNSTNTTECCLEETGCPWYNQPWCETIPALSIYQMLVGFVLIITGYPLASSMSNATFSKIIGPHPQGTYMGMLAAGACVARILCPLCVTSIYSKAGTWATFGFMTGLMGFILLLFFAFYQALVPFNYDDNVKRTYWYTPIAKALKCW